MSGRGQRSKARAPVMPQRLLISIHDVTPRHFERLKVITEFLKTHGVGACLSMLVVPDYWSAWQLDQHPVFCEWLRRQAADGVEMILHGYSHRDDTAHDGVVATLKAKHLTAREGEFLGLDAEHAKRRIEAGQLMLQQILGAPASGFIAPAWLYGPGALAALTEMKFAFAEDHWRVWSPATGAELSRSPVISYASRSKMRIASSLAWSRVATVLLANVKTVRLAIHPGDFDVPSLIAETARAIASFSKTHKVSLYRDLLAA